MSDTANTDFVVNKLENEIATLKDKKTEVALANGRSTTYIKDKIYKHRKAWWAAWEEMMYSEDTSMRKLALIEYNKLQGRVLPTQLEGSSGQQVMINIVGMGIEEPHTTDFIEGETCN